MGHVGPDETVGAGAAPCPVPSQRPGPTQRPGPLAPPTGPLVDRRRPGQRRSPFGRHGWWLASALLLSLSVLVLAVLHSARAVASADQAEQAAALARSAHQVADSVLLDLLDAETGQRGFLLTGDREFLLPYERAVGTLPGRLRTLAELAGPDQERSSADVAGLAGRKLDELAASTALRDASGVPAAAAVVATSRDTSVMDEIRAATETLVAATDEDARASAAFAAGERRVAQLTVVAAAVFLAGNLLAMLALLRQRGRWERQRETLLRDLETLASRDALTGLFNRRLLRDRLEQAVARSLQAAPGSGAGVAVAYLDLDAFKPVNDQLGHHVGDGVLRELAGRLTASVRAGDTLARVGGDEFVVVMEDVSDDLDLEAVRLRLAAACALTVPGLTGVAGAAGPDGVATGHQVTASIGVATLRGMLGDAGPRLAGLGGPGVTETASRLLAAADAAMYDVKRARATPRQEEPVAGP